MILGDRLIVDLKYFRDGEHWAWGNYESAEDIAVIPVDAIRGIKAEGRS